MADFFDALHWSRLLIIPALLIGYTVHELAHALMAYALGDHSQVERGKITLNPLVHISWLGSIFFLLIGAGWPKALRIDPRQFQQPHFDIFLIAIAGPLASFLLCLFGLGVTAIATMLLLLGGGTIDQVMQILFPTTPEYLPSALNFQATLMAFTVYMAAANFWLTFMSILPLPGQDGFLAVVSLVKLVRQPDQAEETEETPVGSLSPEKRLITQSRRRHNNADIHFKIGVEYHQEQKYEDAIARYRQAIGSDQNFGPAYINMGLAYLAKKERQKAISAFRGGIKYADDEKAEAEAWHQLRLLSEVSPVDLEEAAVSMNEMGAAPWTDTKPRPDWWHLGLSSGLLLLSGIFLYGYLLTQVVELLNV